MPRPARLQIKSPAAWRAILSPVRREIVEAMQELGPCPIADVAAASGRPADALYRHVSILVKAGFLVDAGTRKGKRNPERRQRLPGPQRAASRGRRRASDDCGHRRGVCQGDRTIDAGIGERRAACM
jgi:DNA-binding transcriptional ArsR family regulator